MVSFPENLGILRAEKHFPQCCFRNFILNGVGFLETER